MYKVVHVYAASGESRKDLFQEIVASLWKAYPSFRGEAKISTWFYRVALNTAITNYRREKRSVQFQTLNSASFESLTSGLESDGDEDVQLLYEAIGKLTTIDKAIMLLYLEERPYKEISPVLGISPASAGMRIMRAKEKLKALLTARAPGLKGICWTWSTPSKTWTNRKPGVKTRCGRRPARRRPAQTFRSVP